MSEKNNKKRDFNLEILKEELRFARNERDFILRDYDSILRFAISSIAILMTLTFGIGDISSANMPEASTLARSLISLQNIVITFIVPSILCIILLANVQSIYKLTRCSFHMLYLENELRNFSDFNFLLSEEFTLSKISKKMKFPYFYLHLAVSLLLLILPASIIIFRISTFSLPDEGSYILILLVFSSLIWFISTTISVISMIKCLKIRILSNKKFMINKTDSFILD